MTVLNPIAHQVAQMKYVIRVYLWLSRVFFVSGIVLSVLALHEPVGWKLLIGMYLLIRGAVFEVKRDILVMKRDDLLNQL